MQLTFAYQGDVAPNELGIHRISNLLGIAVSENGLIVKLQQVDDSPLRVQFTGTHAVIHFAQPHHLYRAIGLLVEGIRHDEGRPFELQEKPQFDTIGFMLDCSRNAVPKVETVKELLRSMALMGMNMLMLYTEDTYAVENEPYFGYMRGRFTIEEIQECDAYAEEMGIELVPCIQTLAHLDTFLKWEAAAPLRDTPDVLLVGEENTYAFIERLIRTISSAFRTRRVHIGMDEAIGLGRGRLLDQQGYRDRSSLMDEHLARVTEITAKYNLEPMLWSDMFFRTASETHDYYDKTVAFTEKDSNRIPAKTQLVYWDYYSYDLEAYRLMIRKHQQLGQTPIFAGGIWTWLGLSTDYDRTYKCTNAALSACKQEGVNEIFATAWGDNGAENNLWTVLPGLQLFAEHAYSESFDEEKYKRRTAFCTGIDYDQYQLIGKLDDVPGLPVDHGATSNASKYLLWQDVLLGLFDRHFLKLDTAKHYKELEIAYVELASRGELEKRVFDIPAKLSAVLYLKADMGNRLKRAYDAQDREQLQHIAEFELSDLEKKVEQLRIAHRKYWMKTNKPFGWEILDLRYGGLIARLKSAQDRLFDFLNGSVSAIEELEEERLFFDNRKDADGPGTDYFVNYHLMASPNKMI